MWHLDRAQDDSDLDRIDTAHALLPAWPQTSLSAAGIELAEAPDGDEVGAVERAAVWAGRATRDDPREPAAWRVLCTLERLAGESAAARQACLQELALNPWSTSAANRLGAIARDEGDDDEARRWWERSLRVSPDQPEVRAALEALDDEADAPTGSG
jgi:tetratricopeptide (TPR) repeat protein